MENYEKTTAESLMLSVQALALVKSIRDIILTVEQRKQIPELYKKYTLDIAKQCYERLGLSFEELQRGTPQTGPSRDDF